MLAKVLVSTKFDDNFAIIKLTRGMVAIVDPEDFEALNKYHWQAKKSFCRWYAARKYYYNNKTHWCFMHRQIMHTPKNQIVHHKNRRTMDNRKINLANMYQEDHRFLHVQRFPGRMLVKKSSK